jgi:hypothetical protein
MVVEYIVSSRTARISPLQRASQSPSGYLSAFLPRSILPRPPTSVAAAYAAVADKRFTETTGVVGAFEYRWFLAVFEWYRAFERFEPRIHEEALAVSVIA